MSRGQARQDSHLHFTTHTLWVGSLLASHYELAVFPRLGSLPGGPLAWDTGGWWEKGLATHPSPSSYSGAHPKEATQVTAGPMVRRLSLCPSWLGSDQRVSFLQAHRPQTVRGAFTCPENASDQDPPEGGAANSGPLRTRTSEPACVTRLLA